MGVVSKYIQQGHMFPDKIAVELLGKLPLHQKLYLVEEVGQQYQRYVCNILP
jgi:hypothetical protein